MGSTSNPTDVHLVFTATPGYGHVRPLKSLAKSLTARGYTITFVCNKTFRALLSGIHGVDFVQFEGAADWNTDNMEETFPTRREQPQDATLAIWDIENVFLAGFDDQVNTLKSVIERPELAEKQVVLVSDGTLQSTGAFFLDSPLLPRVPIISVAPIPVLCLSKDTMPFGFGLPSQGEEKNQEANAMVTQSFAGTYNKVVGLLEKYECRKEYPHPFPVHAWMLLCDAWLQLTIPELEHPRSDLPSHFRDAGALLGANDNKGLPQWYDEFVVHGDPSKPLIMVTMGTIPAMQSSDLILPTVEACRNLPVRLVVCAVNAALPPDYDIPPNVRVASWLPFEDLFQYTSVVVSNGGYGGITQAFAAGIPMVVAGTTEDKIETTARAAMTGAAINLQCKTVSPEQMKEALQRVLGESSFKEKAMGLKRAFGGYDAVGAVEETIVKVIGDFKA